MTKKSEDTQKRVSSEKNETRIGLAQQNGSTYAVDRCSVVGAGVLCPPLRVHLVFEPVGHDDSVVPLFSFVCAADTSVIHP